MIICIFILQWEELWHLTGGNGDENNSISTAHPKIFKAQDDFIEWQKLEIEIKKLEKLALKNDLEKIIILLKKLVVGYKPSERIVDYIFNEKFNKDIY